MKKLLLILILAISIQSFAKADDIRDFEIEGMSIGDSLLDHFSEKNIIKELNSKYVFKYKSDFIRIAAGKGEGFYLIKDSKQYDDIGITLKLNDKRYIIYSLSGRIFCDDEIKDCFDSQKNITNNLKDFLGDSVKFKTWERVNPDDITKKSKIFHNDFIFKKSNGLITVGVYNYSKSYTEKTGFYSHAVIAIYSEEFNNFLDNE
jgi:hypothetical protein